MSNWTGSMLPGPDHDQKFLQIYFMIPAAQVHRSLEVFSDLQSDAFSTLSRLMEKQNPFVQGFCTA